MITHLSFAPATGVPQPFSGFGVPRYRHSRSIGLLLAALLHVLLLWLILARDTPVLKPPSAGTEGAITYVAPLAQAILPKPITQVKPAPPKPPERKPPPQEPTPPKPKAQKTPPLTRPAAVTPPKAPVQPPVETELPQLATAQPLTPAPNVAPQTDAVREPPAEDFSARIEAARKRRAEARGQDPAVAEAETETESQRANRIARENIAFQQRGQGATREQTGGVFQLRNVGPHSAEFAFRGWNTNFKRNWSQVVSVDQGAEADIAIAVVKRMIALIRTQKAGEFIWESHRLGKQIKLNADVAYEGELQQFLLKEFFPTYVKTVGRG